MSGWQERRWGRASGGLGTPKGRKGGRGGGGGGGNKGGGGRRGRGNQSGGPAAPQPVFANVMYLPDHQNAANSSKVLADLATGGTGNPHPMSWEGNVRNDTGDSAFGSGSSLIFDGNGDVLHRGIYHADFVPISAETKDTAEFCWEWHAKRQSNTGDMFARYKPSTNDRVFRFALTGAPLGRTFINAYQNGTDIWLGAGTTTEVPTGEWFHFACTRQNGFSATPGSEDIIRMFVNGVVERSFVVGTTDGFHPDRTVKVEWGSSGGGNYWNGRIDNIRIVIGEPVYTENFTPLTARHPTP